MLTTTVPEESIAILCFYPWVHLADTACNTLTFKDHWPHDLHDFAERPFTFYNDYNFYVAKGNRTTVCGENV